MFWLNAFEESDIKIKPVKGAEPQMEVEEPNYLFSIVNESSQKGREINNEMPNFEQTSLC